MTAPEIFNIKLARAEGNDLVKLVRGPQKIIILDEPIPFTNKGYAAQDRGPWLFFWSENGLYVPLSNEIEIYSIESHDEKKFRISDTVCYGNVEISDDVTNRLFSCDIKEKLKTLYPKMNGGFYSAFKKL